MANVYWHADGGNWSDHATHWFNATDGGGGGHGAAPGADDNAIFDANSFDNPAQIVTVDASASCLAMTWTGATNTPTLAGAATLTAQGSLTFIAAMTFAHTGTINLPGTSTLTTNGLDLATINALGISGAVTLGDALTITSASTSHHIAITGGTFDTGNFDVTAGAIYTALAAAKTITLGSSTITTNHWDMSGGGAVTFTANTSTIIVLLTGVFSGFNIATYNIVNLNGTAHTISGSNTFAALTLKADTTQTITFTDGTTQTITTPTVTGSVGKVKTLTGSGAAGWTITKAGGGTVTADYLALTYSQATPADTWYHGDNCTVGAGVTGWLPVIKTPVADGNLIGIAVIRKS